MSETSDHQLKLVTYSVKLQKLNVSSCMYPEGIISYNSVLIEKKKRPLHVFLCTYVCALNNFDGLLIGQKLKSCTS